MNSVQGQYSQIHNTTIENNWVTNISPVDLFCEHISEWTLESFEIFKVLLMYEKAKIYGHRLNVYYRLEKYGA